MTQTWTHHWTQRAASLGAAGLLAVVCWAAPQTAMAEGVGFSAADVSAKYTSGAKFLSDQNAWGAGEQTDLSWQGSRFGFSMSLDDPKMRQTTQSDVSAEAYFRVTPSVRLGTELKLGARAQERVITPDEREPRVRFETAFEF